MCLNLIGLFNGPAAQRIKDSPLEDVIVTNTLPLPESVKKLSKVKQLNLAPILAEAIRRLYLGEDIHLHKNGPFVSML